MATSIRILVFVAALVAAALVLLRAGDGAPRPEIAAAASADPMARTLTADAVGAADGERSPVELPVGPGAPTGLDHPFAYELTVRVVDHRGIPVPGADLRIAPLGCALDDLPDETDADGLVTVRWAARSSSMTVALEVSGQGRSLRNVELRAAEPRTITLLGADRFRVRSRRNGMVLSGFFVTGGDGASGRAAPRPDLSARGGLHPFGFFADLAAGGELAAAPGERSGAVEISFDGGEISGLGGLRVSGGSIVISGGDDAGQAGNQIVGTVIDADGAPVPRCLVLAGLAVDRADAYAFTDDDGAYRIDGVPAGSVEVRAGGLDEGLARDRVVVAEGTAARWDACLSRGATIRGRVARAQGDGKAPRQRVEFVARDGGWVDACTVRDDGSFVLTNLPAVRGDLLLWNVDDEWLLPVQRIDAVQPDDGEVLFTDGPDAPKYGSIVFESRLPDGLSVDRLTARVLQEATLRVATLGPDRPTGRWSIAHLPAGWYDITILGPGLAGFEAGRCFVDGKQVVDLGVVGLPTPAVVDWSRGARALPPQDQPPDAELYRRRPDVDVRIEPARLPDATTWLLPAGDYWLCWRAPDGSARQRAVALHAGVRTAIAVPPDDAR